MIALRATFDKDGDLFDYSSYPVSEGYKRDNVNDVLLNAVDILSVVDLGYVDCATRDYCFALSWSVISKNPNLPFLRAKPLLEKCLKLT